MNELEEIQLSLDQLETYSRQFLSRQQYHLVDDLHTALCHLVATFGAHVTDPTEQASVTNADDVELHPRYKPQSHTAAAANTPHTTGTTDVDATLAHLKDIELYIADKISQYGPAYHRDLFQPADQFNTGVVTMSDFCHILRKIGVYLVAQERQALAAKFPPTDDQRAQCVERGVILAEGIRPANGDDDHDGGAASNDATVGLNYVLFLLYLQALSNTTTATQWAKRVPVVMANRSMVAAVHPTHFQPTAAAAHMYSTGAPHSSSTPQSTAPGAAEREPYLQVNARELAAALKTLQTRQPSTTTLYRKLKQLCQANRSASQPDEQGSTNSGIAVASIADHLASFGFPITQLTCSRDALVQYIQLYSEDNQQSLTFNEFVSFVSNATPTRLRVPVTTTAAPAPAAAAGENADEHTPGAIFAPSGPLVSPLHPPFHKGFQHIMRQVNCTPARDYFRRLDTNRDHFISITELLTDFRAMGLPQELAASPHCFDFIARYAQRLPGHLTFNEFLLFRECVHVHTNRNYAAHHQQQHPHHQLHSTTVVDGMTLWQSICTIRTHFTVNKHLSLYDVVNNVIDLQTTNITRPQFHVLLHNAGIVVSTQQADAIFTGLSPQQDDEGQEFIPRDELLTTVRTPEAHPLVYGSKRHGKTAAVPPAQEDSVARYQPHVTRGSIQQSNIAVGDIGIERLADEFHTLTLKEQFNPHSKRNNQRNSLFGDEDGEDTAARPAKGKRPSRRSDIFDPVEETATSAGGSTAAYRKDVAPAGRIDFGRDHGGVTPLKQRKHYALQQTTFVLGNDQPPSTSDGASSSHAHDDDGDATREDIDGYYDRRRAMRKQAGGAAALHASVKGHGDSTHILAFDESHPLTPTAEVSSDDEGENTHQPRRRHEDSNILTLQAETVSRTTRQTHPLAQAKVVVGIPDGVQFTPASKASGASRRRVYHNQGVSAVLLPVEQTHPDGGYRSPLFIRRQYDMLTSRGAVHHLDDNLQPADTPLILKRQSRLQHHVGSVDTKLSRYVNPGGVNLRRLGYTTTNHVERVLNQSYNEEYKNDQSFVDAINKAASCGHGGHYDDEVVQTRLQRVSLVGSTGVVIAAAPRPTADVASGASSAPTDIPKLNFDDDYLHVHHSHADADVDPDDHENQNQGDADDDVSPDGEHLDNTTTTAAQHPPETHEEDVTANSTVEDDHLDASDDAPPVDDLCRRIAQAVYRVIGKTSRQTFNDWSRFGQSMSPVQLVAAVNKHLPVAQHLTDADAQRLFADVSPSSPSSITFSGFTRILSRGSD